jgi:hypothetical protein
MTGGETRISDSLRSVVFPVFMIRSPSQILQSNEKAKAWSTMVGNLGTALTIAGFGALWVNGPDPWSVVWIAFGFATMAFAAQMLSHLESES